MTPLPWGRSDWPRADPDLQQPQDAAANPVEPKTADNRVKIEDAMLLLKDQKEFPSQASHTLCKIQTAAAENSSSSLSDVSRNFLFVVPTAAMQFFLVRSSQLCTAYADPCMQPC